MELSDALDLGRDALLLAITLAGPILGMGVLVGLSISIFQAVTQLQEQTLTFVPKIIAMIIAAVLFVPWIATKLLEYTQEMMGRVP